MTKAIDVKPNLVHEARKSLREHINAPDWDWDRTGKYERHAINAVLDLEVAEQRIKELEAELASKHFPEADSAVGNLDNARCAICGWPLVDGDGLSPLGCVRGNCSLRPRPYALYDPTRAALESNLASSTQPSTTDKERT